MKRYTIAETAQAIRQTLKQAFPGTKFSVTCRKGSSIHATWIDGPLESRVSAIVKRFEGCGFDGMQDMKTYNEAVHYGGQLVEFHAGYVFAERRISRDLLRQAAERAARETGLPLLELHPEWNTLVAGRFQIEFTYFADGDVVARGKSQRVAGGEWYTEFVQQIARNTTTPHQVGTPDLPRYQNEVAAAPTTAVQ